MCAPSLWVCRGRVGLPPPLGPPDSNISASYPPLPSYHSLWEHLNFGEGERGQPPTSPRHSSFLISSFSSLLLRVSLLPSLPEYLWKVVTIVVRAFSRGVSMMVCSSGGRREEADHKPDLLLAPISSPVPRLLPQGPETGIHDETKIHQQVVPNVSSQVLVRPKAHLEQPKWGE